MKALGITGKVGGNQNRNNKGGGNRGGRNRGGNRKMSQKQKLKLLKQQLEREEQEKLEKENNNNNNNNNNKENENENDNNSSENNNDEQEKEEKSQDKSDKQTKENEKNQNLQKKDINSSDDSNSDEEEKAPPKRNNRKYNRNRGRNSNRGSNRNRGVNNNNRNKKTKVYDDSSDDSDSDIDLNRNKKNSNRKKSNNSNKQQDTWSKTKSNNTYADDSDSDEEIQKPKKVKKNNKKQNNKHSDEKIKSGDQDEKKNDNSPEKESSPVSPNDNKNNKKKNKKNKKDKKKKAPLKSPICVVMGHVDTGKTKILDHIRRTSIQDREVGGITQQIGATFLSTEYLAKETQRMTELKSIKKVKLKVPGLLFIDTPGHESFTNLRARGSSLCDIAILVVDLMHGLEPQTKESIKLLKEKGAPFVVALNKIDRCSDWIKDDNAPFQSTFKKQKKHTQKDFMNRLSNCMLQFSEQGLNCALWYENKDFKSDISLVPTSAHTGEGIPDLLYLITQLTQRYMEKKLAFKENKFVCNVLEVKNTRGHGTTLDVILSNGVIRQGDRIVCCGMKGQAIDTTVRALLLPHEASEMRDKKQDNYKIVQEVHASAGLRISAKGLDDAVPGSDLLLIPPKIINMRDKNRKYEEIEKIKDGVQDELDRIFANVDKNERGVFVQSSTLGSLEALIRFLNEQKIPICGMGIGSIKKEDVIRAGRMLEHQKEFACILAFNITILPDAREIANKLKVKIFEAEIIYHLQDQFEKYVKDIRENRKIAAKDVAVFPVELEILPEHVIRNKHPIVIGCKVKRGTLRLNTPLCAKKYENGQPKPVYLGKVVSLQNDNKDVPIGKVGDKLAVKIEGTEDDGTRSIQVGRQFTTDHKLVSQITRDSLDALKLHFKDEIVDDKMALDLLRQLKQYFKII